MFFSSTRKFLPQLTKFATPLVKFMSSTIKNPGDLVGLGSLSNLGDVVKPKAIIVGVFYRVGEGMQMLEFQLTKNKDPEGNLAEAPLWISAGMENFLMGCVPPETNIEKNTIYFPDHPE